MTGNLKVSKKEFWEERYIQNNMPWDIGQVAPAFIKYLNNEKISTGTTAVLGSGLGHDAFYFASLNFPVYGFDFSESAIQSCNKLKEKNKVENIYFYQKDFFEITKEKSWKNYFDFVVEHTTLCAIDPERRTEYIDLIKYLLKPGGKLIGLFFVRTKELGGPPFGSTPEEIRKLFSADFTEVFKLCKEECLHEDKLKGDEYFGVFRK